jgi:pyruvate carboxylase subunit A
MGEVALQAARAVDYQGVGTVEFIYDNGQFFFLEMNTRLQVEHPVTELVTGIDLVYEQFHIAQGARLSVRQEEVQWRGHALECRINAEDWAHEFMPSSGRITGYHEPSGPGVRVDGSIIGRGEISPHYDPMIAKLITWGETRSVALQRMRRALFEYIITGITTNIPYHLAILEDTDFVSGDYTTRFIGNHPELIHKAQQWSERQKPLERLVHQPHKIAAIAAAAIAAH